MSRRLRDRSGSADHNARMAAAKNSTPPAPPKLQMVRFPPEVEAAWIQGCAEIDRGEFVTLTPEQLERCAETGEWPWPEESQD